MLNEFNEKLKNAQNLSLTQAADLCATFLEEDLTDAAIAETLVLLAKKGETADEICGFAQALLQRATPVPFDHGTVDVCGTGGSDLERFNVSTAAAFVLACAGLSVAKHGNRGSKRPNGSFDLLEALEVPFQLNGDQVAQCLNQTGIGFLFARSFHPTMRKVVEARRQAKRRTIFNLAAPLCNPTQVAYQLVGTAARPMGRILAQSCIRLGRPQGCVVWGAANRRAFGQRRIRPVSLCRRRHPGKHNRRDRHRHRPAVIRPDPSRRCAPKR
jgi:anthranilate phosphoribosyltransferase